MLENIAKVIQRSKIIFFEVPFSSLATKLNVQGQAEQHNEKKNPRKFFLLLFFLPLLMSERTSAYFLEILQFEIAIVFGSVLTSKLVTLNSKTPMIDMWVVK